MVERRPRAVLTADDPAGIANHGASVGDGLEHDRARADLYVIAKPDRAEHLRARADDHAVAQRGMPLAVLLAGAAQRYALVQRHVVADLRRFADDDARAVVDEQPVADRRAGVNLDAGAAFTVLGYQARQQDMAFFVQPVGKPVRSQCLDAGITEHDLQLASCSRIPRHDGGDILFPIGRHKPLLINKTVSIRKRRHRPRFHSA